MRGTSQKVATQMYATSPLAWHIQGMPIYRIVPAKGAYRVEVVAAGGRGVVIQTWPTEEAAILHLKALRQRAELADRQANSGGQDWRG
jgi:hypothetical protein